MLPHPCLSLLVPALLTTLAATALPTAAAAQTGQVWVVDAALGSGADFATVGDAIAAASVGDTVLVRSGVYPPFLLTFKNLAVMADEGADVQVFDGPAVFFTPNGPPNVLHGIDFISSGAPAPLIGISTGDIGARTWLSDCSTESASIDVSSSSIVLDKLVLRGVDAVNGAPARPALFQGQSFVAAFETEFFGGAGEDGSASAAPSAGAPAVSNKLVLWAANSRFLGGAGGDGVFDPVAGCLPPASGGAGAEVAGRLFDNSSQLLGGAGGLPAAGCAGVPGAAGEPFVLTTPTAQAIASPAPAPRLTTPGVVREGQVLEFGWEGPSGAALLLISGAPDFKHSQFSPLSNNSMPLLVAQPYSIFLLDVLPTGGTTSLSFTVPELGPGVESRRIYAQALHLNLFNFAVNSGGARTVVLLDSSF